MVTRDLFFDASHHVLGLVYVTVHEQPARALGHAAPDVSLVARPARIALRERPPLG